MGIISGGGGALPAGLSSGIVYQTGAGSPVDAVTPTQKGAVYQDKTNGALYVAMSALVTGWVALGTVSGNIGEATGAVWLGVSRSLYLMAGERDTQGAEVYLGTAWEQWNGHGQGLKWHSTGTEGLEFLDVTTGATGQYIGTLQDGSGNSSVPGVVAEKGIKTAAISSGALPTVQLVSGTGAQILTARDAETVTPCTFNPGAATTATVTVALSPDNVTYSTLVVVTEPAGVALDGTVLPVKVCVPGGWYLKLTANAQAVLGLTTYY